MDGVTVRTLSLGDNAAPIDVAIAFGSIWVANHHANSVTRLDPESMAVQASIPAGSGPGWIVVTDDAVWVSDQNDVGLKRIDPETNTAPTKAGKWPPCGDGVLAFGSIWQPACDAKRILRIDPTTFATTDINAPAQFWALLVRDRLITAGPNGLATLDPKTNAFTPIGGQDPGRMMAFDGTTIWSSDEQQVLRIRPNDGSVMATLPIPEAGTVAFVDRRAWVTSSTGLVEVDPVKNAIVRTLPIGRSVSVAAGGGSLWVTSYDANTLTRVRP